MSEAPVIAASIGSIEAALLKRVADANADDAFGYRLKTVAVYTGQLEADDLAQMVPSFPAALLTYTGDWREPQRHTGGWKHFPEFVWLAAARNMRNAALGRQRAAPDQVGAGQIVADLRALLVDQDLSLDIDRLQPGRTQALVNSATQGREAAVLAFTLRTGFIEPARQSAGSTAEFLTVHAQWDLPPLGPRPTEPLPVPAADAADSYAVRE